MQAGRLRNAGAIQQIGAQTRDAIGGVVPTWTDLVSSWWFELLEVAGGETMRGRTVHAEARYLAIGRNVSGVTAKMRLTFAGRTLDILRAYDPDGRGRELRLDLLERSI